MFQDRFVGPRQSKDAPFPRRIDLNCELNASAGFRRGTFSFLGNDLVLTIGLPLAAAMDIRQFGGIIAHEFGHFTQGMGMRLTYLIRSINGWFARVVYERDGWDLALEEWAQSEYWQVQLLAGLALLAVAFSRFLLSLIMWIGHGIGCFMLRQMEYDADSYQIKVGGSETFESAAKALHTLGAALGESYQSAQISWSQYRRLPENFPAFVALHHQNMPAQLRADLEDSSGLGRTGHFDTHPSVGDRIREARRAAEPGVVNLEGPAARLFSNFEAVSKQITLLHYAEDLGLPIRMAKLVPVPEESCGKETPQPADGPEPVTPSSQEDPIVKTKLRIQLN
jgi:hypothetical protein